MYYPEDPQVPPSKFKALWTKKKNQNQEASRAQFLRTVEEVIKAPGFDPLQKQGSWQMEYETQPNTKVENKKHCGFMFGFVSKKITPKHL